MPSDSSNRDEGISPTFNPSSSLIPLAPLLATSPPPSRSHSGSPSPQDTLTLRALVSTKDAGVIIGKGGKNVAELREQTGVKAGVSKVIPGVHERVLTVSGSVEAVAKVSFAFSPLRDYKCLTCTPPPPPPPFPPKRLTP